MVKHMAPKVEKKYFDTLVSGSAVTAATITPLGLIAQGSDVNQRVGNTIVLTSIQFKGDCVVGDATNFVRHMIVLDRDSNGVAPVTADILDASTITSTIWCPYNNDNKLRLRVLYDNVYNINTVNQPYVLDKQFLKLGGKKGIQSVYAASGAAQVNLLTNQLYSLVVSDSALGPHPAVFFGYRLRYTDA